MALNDSSHLSVPTEDDATPHSPRAISAIALVGLPPLTGTEAEITEATPTRERLLIAADDFLTTLRANEILTEEQADTAISVPQPVSEAEVKAAQVALNRLRHQAEAAWWISQQTAAIETLLAHFTEQR